MRNWTIKEILILKRACRRGLSPDAIAELLPRHSVRGIVVRARKEQIKRRVRFGSLADIAAELNDVGFTPESGHS